MKKFLKHLSLLLLFVLLCVSCNKQLNRSLELAYGNRAEIEKVLEYFKNDPDPLKMEAASFLIENMPHHYSYFGKEVELYDSAYIAISSKPLQYRDSIFKELTHNVDINNSALAFDISTAKAEYLISIINDACNIWNETGWSDTYDKSIFFDYVLPYRLLNEPYSDWRKFIKEEYPYLFSQEVQSKRGEQIEAEEANSAFGNITKKASASGGKVVFLTDTNCYIIYNYAVNSTTRKRILLRYTSTAMGAEVTLKLNGECIDTLHLEPTSSQNVFRDTRKSVDITLKKGNNTIAVCYSKGDVGLDYTQFTSVEAYNEKEETDFGRNVYLIQNKGTQQYISFKVQQDSEPKVLCTKKAIRNDSTGLLCIDYLGYACWRISPLQSNDKDVCMEVGYCHTNPMASVTQYKFINGNNQKWVFFPLGNGYYKIMNKDSGLYLGISHDNETGIDTLVQNRYLDIDTQKWKIRELGERQKSDNDKLFKKGTPIAAALKIFDITNQYEWIGYDSPIPPKALSLCKGRTGNCRDEASYTVYLCRSMGIPAAVDFTPHWGNRSLSHSWSVLIKPDGTATPFYMGCAPGDTVHYFHGYKKPKVFRHRFQLNREYASDFIHEKEIPTLFVYPDYIDVTNEYYTTTDVRRSIPMKFRDKKIAYICVFDNRKWIPVFYGKIKDGIVDFLSMGRNIMYIAAFYQNGEIVPFGNPFYIDNNGNINDIVLNADKRHDMTLLRKYPFMGKEDFFNLRMDGGRFQGANKPDFSDAITLYKYEGIPEGNWIEKTIDNKQKYRYIRYLGPPASYGNINEIVFYDSNHQALSGKVIGTEGEPWATKEKVFDGDILTGFNGISPDGHWVGLKLNRPEKIGSIRFIPRNDGNGIEIGDTYELYVWYQGRWKKLRICTAKKNLLFLQKIPSNGLYVLSDITKGHEERIFTYEHNKQVWW